MVDTVDRLFSGFMVILLVGMALTCPYFHHTNRLVQLETGNYAVQRCRSFMNMYCDLLDENPDRQLAFEAWQRWEALDHPPAVVRQLLP